MGLVPEPRLAGLPDEEPSRSMDARASFCRPCRMCQKISFASHVQAGLPRFLASTSIDDASASCAELIKVPGEEQIMGREIASVTGRGRGFPAWES
jgi:hypothetical protein